MNALAASWIDLKWPNKLIRFYMSLPFCVALITNKDKKKLDILIFRFFVSIKHPSQLLRNHIIHIDWLLSTIQYDATILSAIEIIEVSCQETVS